MKQLFHLRETKVSCLWNFCGIGRK